MANSKTGVQRPLSPHLQVYRFTTTMLMSIVHRITGGALYFGILLLVGWLLAAASGPEAFDMAQGFFGSWFGILVLLGFSWTLIHHAIGGIRHLVWDTGAGLGPKGREAWGLGTIIGSVVITAALWIGAFVFGLI
ncbi:succinate dehydrogenase, cytochrome b556 subunit [Agaricicola taiwanensis]|uniref:Succinate dehydrogenase cytochrome b556 subunit n=1 Tax=Agaricicola taiwanensis TaxID=591372 RepID=A0A8J2VK44_9RHOB|nr:succinate dehydrogenase, cytochrome b556 subunit [Agaricicola taiwanensis]GGE27268.1 succinate dehydrogenase, cytochrome b556 subunit [Agaricicola taiwanensis]